jgi:heparan-alpha-glucosaminide N-acetyltransferase
MASTLTEPAAAPARPPASASSRLTSLDAFRGFIMLILASSGFGLAVLKNYPDWTWLANQFDHAAWQGCTFWDLIQPAFTFMVGVAMPLAIARRHAEGATNSQIFRHVLSRAFLLIVISNIYSNWGTTKPLSFQLINVLCQIAIGYVLCFLITRLPFKAQAITAAATLAGYWALFVAFPGPDGPFSQTGNIGAVLDLKLLGYNYSGFYTTLNSIGNAMTILFGCWTGLLFQSSRTHTEKLKILAIAAVAAFTAAFLLEPFNPMVKRLWTVSFTFFSTGWVLLMLMAFYWIIEVKQRKRWAFPLTVVGMNSIFIYSLGQIGIKGWLDRGLTAFTGKFPVLGDLGIIPHQILVLACMWYACYWLYQRKIFFKV